MNPWFYFVFYGVCWFALGGIFVGTIINTIRKAEIHDLQELLRGCGVIRQYPKRWFWSRAWGIRVGQWLPRWHRRRGSQHTKPLVTQYHSSTQIFQGGNYDRNK